MKVVANIAHTGCRRADHITVVVKIKDKLLSHCFGLFPKSTVKGHLTAAGLLIVVTDPGPCPCKYFDHVNARFGKNLVDITRYEKIDFLDRHDGAI
jgi:hypothetical protein